MQNKNKGKSQTQNKPKKGSTLDRLITVFAAFVLLILVGYFIYDIIIFGNGKKTLTKQEQITEYEGHADRILKNVKVEMAKSVSPYKFILKNIKDIERYSWQALDIDSTLTSSWERLGYVNAQIHGKQAILRYESYKKQNKPEKVTEEEKNIITYFTKANLYYDKALEFGTDDSARVYFGKSEAAVVQKRFDQSAIELLKAIKLDPENPKYKAKLIEAYLYGGRFQKALTQIELYKRAYPDSDEPYVYMAGYYYNMGDTLQAIGEYEKAIDKGTRPDVGKFLARYYSQLNDTAKVKYYMEKAREAEATYDPEKY
jgi:tetratricopeptide (TPR) repeat protein